MFDTPAANAIAGGLAKGSGAPESPAPPLPFGSGQTQGKKAGKKKSEASFASSFLGEGAYTPTPASVPGKTLLGE